MQKWEYTTVLQTRAWRYKDECEEWHQGDTFEDIDQTLAELGEAGWELIAVTPRSSFLGGFNCGYANHSHDYAGFTSEQLWVFKRPKAEPLAEPLQVETESMPEA